MQIDGESWFYEWNDQELFIHKSIQFMIDRTNEFNCFDEN